jgi:hypothetical protein
MGLVDLILTGTSGWLFLTEKCGNKPSVSSSAGNLLTGRVSK